jgi:transcriptional regulator with XRE-family HTH domain
MTTRPSRDKTFEDQGVSKSDLASRIRRSKGYITQLLGGERNLTLRTLAEVAYALGTRVTLDTEPVDKGRSRRPARSVSMDAGDTSFSRPPAIHYTYGQRCMSHKCPAHGEPSEQMSP